MLVHLVTLGYFVELADFTLVDRVESWLTENMAKPLSKLRVKFTY